MTSSSSSFDREDRAIRRLYGKLIDGWNRGDAEAFAAPFSTNADLVGFDGTHLRGQQEISSFHQPLFDKWLKGTRLVGEVDEVRFLAPDLALVHARGSTVMRGRAGRSPDRDSVQTIVARKRDGDWRIEAFHNTRLRPMGGSTAGAVLWLLTDTVWKLVRWRAPAPWGAGEEG